MRVGWHVNLSAALIILIGLLCTAFAFAGESSSAAQAETSVVHVDAKRAQQLVSEKQVVVVDLRTPTEFKAGHISGATNLDFQASDFEERLKKLDKSKSYLIHCAVGGRSSRSLPTFKRQEFVSIYHLDGGIKAWEKAGLPLEK